MISVIETPNNIYFHCFFMHIEMTENNCCNQTSLCVLSFKFQNEIAEKGIKTIKYTIGEWHNARFEFYTKTPIKYTI